MILVVPDPTFVSDYFRLLGVTRLVQAHDVVPQVGASGGRHDFDSAHVFADLDADLTHLQRQLTGRHHDHGCSGTNRAGQRGTGGPISTGPGPPPHPVCGPSSGLSSPAAG